MPDSNHYLTELYEKMLRLQPDLTGCRIHVSPQVAEVAGWTEGQLLTKYNLPVVIDNRIKERAKGNSTYESDIWVLDD